MFQGPRKTKQKGSKTSLDDFRQVQNVIKEEIQFLRKKLRLTKENTLEEQKEDLNQILGLQVFDSKEKSKGKPLMIEDNGGPFELVNTIEIYLTQKWYCEVHYKLKEGYKFKHRILMDSAVDVNCMREGFIHSRYFEKSIHRIHIAYREQLMVDYKIPEIHVCISKNGLMTSFLLVKNLKQGIILGNLLFALIKSFTITEEGIATQINGKSVIFKFCFESEESFLNQLKEAIKYVKRREG